MRFASSLGQTLTGALALAAAAVQAAGPYPHAVNNGPAVQGAPNVAAITQAQPYKPQVRSITPLRAPSLTFTGGNVTQARPGHPGGASAAHLARQWPAAAPAAGATKTSGRTAEALGWAGLPFTSARVDASLDTTYPNSAVGQLIFSDGTNWYACTGSMIAPGMVLTAGHCAHSGSGEGSGFFRDFTFIPGLRYLPRKDLTLAPYGVWSNWRAVYTSNSWYNGGGTVPNPQDWALVMFGHQDGKHIGHYTGWLGWSVGKASMQQTTVLGYPYNLGWGGQLNRVDALSVDLFDLAGVQFNNIIWGSDMKQGSSGGPVVKNWGRAYPDLTAKRPKDSWRNLVVSVVSWGSDSMPNMAGGSMFDMDFVGMFEQACTDLPEAC